MCQCRGKNGQRRERRQPEQKGAWKPAAKPAEQKPPAEQKLAVEQQTPQRPPQAHDELLRILDWFYKMEMMPKSHDVLYFLRRESNLWDAGVLRQVASELPDRVRITFYESDSKRTAPGRGKERFMLTLLDRTTPNWIDLDTAHSPTELVQEYQALVQALTSGKDVEKWSGKEVGELAFSLLLQELDPPTIARMKLGPLRRVVSKAVKDNVLCREKGLDGKHYIVLSKEFSHPHQEDSSSSRTGATRHQMVKTFMSWLLEEREIKLTTMQKRLAALELGQTFSVADLEELLRDPMMAMVCTVEEDTVTLHCIQSSLQLPQHNTFVDPPEEPQQQGNCRRRCVSCH